MGGAYRALDDVLRKWRYAPERGITGSYVCRAITGGTNYSLHAYADGGPCTFWNGTRVTMAVAVDINWSRNPYGPKLITDMDRRMVEEICAIRTGNGVQVWGWGGYYSGNKDAMHYELRCTPADLRTGIRNTSTPPPQEDDMADPKVIDQLNRIEARGSALADAVARLEARRQWALVLDEEDTTGAVWLTDGFVRRWVQDGNHLQGLASFYGLDASNPSRWKHNDVVRIPIEPGTDLPPDA